MTGCAERLTVQSGSARRIRFSCRRDYGRGRITRPWRAAAYQICRNVASVRVTKLVVRHGGRCRIGLGVLQPTHEPLACRLIGDVNKRRRMIARSHRRAVGQFDRMTVDTAVVRQDPSALIELGRSWERVLVALSAAGFDVSRWQNRHFASACAVVCLGDRGGGPLATMTNYAAKCSQRMRNYRMTAERLRRHICEACFSQSFMACCAAIDDTKVRQPHLLNTWLEA